MQLWYRNVAHDRSDYHVDVCVGSGGGVAHDRSDYHVDVCVGSGGGGYITFRSHMDHVVSVFRVYAINL